MKRRIFTGHAAALAIVLGALSSAVSAGDAGPRFRADGIDADAYGRGAGYPTCTGLSYMRDLGCRVGAFSNFDTLFPSRAIAASKSPVPLRRADGEPVIRYTHAGQSRTLDDYLNANPVTGLLIARGDTILVERYQYARTDKQRLASFSMAKTIVALLIGIAVRDGAIKSIDDAAEIYVPGLKGTEYGRTPVKALLQMASGVAFNENYADFASDVYVLANLTIGQDPAGSLAAVKRFNTRYAPPGERHSYSSAETLVLGLVLAGATKRTMADYAAEKLWGPLGAEADASWMLDATGQEVAFAYYNATLRDWARLGLMLAHDGSWNGNSVVPRDWLLAATSIGQGSPFWSSSMKPGQHVAGYGYQTWLLMADRRMFALRGLRDQFVLVDPATKLVLVQTALRDGTQLELYALWAALTSAPP